MSEIIISQLDRAFANPLETNRQVNFISDRDAISALRRWEGMQVYVKSELTTYELRGGILNEHWTDISGVDSANYTPTGGYAGTAQDIVDSIETVTGGIENISITHIANLDYYVIADPYKINSEYYSASPTTVTLTVGDATNPRIDVIYADINGLIGVLPGTPAPSPVKPIVSSTQRELTFRTVPALATVDPVVTNELVFDENVGVAGGEFDVDGYNLTALNFNSAAVAFSGTKSIYFDGVDPYFNVDFKNDANIAVSGLSSFFFRVYVTEVLNKNASLIFSCLDTSFAVNGSARIVKDGYFGFDRNVLNTWQIISIPISYFNLTVTEIKGIRFYVSSINKPKMYMDTLTFQSNVTQPTPTIAPVNFLQLTDTPTTYAGQSGKVPKVNVGETALAFENLTKSDVGLSNVDNTSDVNKPVSTAQQTALDAKLDDTDALTAVTPTNKLITEDDMTATAVSVDSAGFTGNLTPTDDTVQKVADKVDALVLGGVGGEIVYNVKTNGVLGDGIDLTDGNITAGTNIFTSSSAVFTLSDVGKTIGVLGVVTGGGFLITTISAYVNANSVTLTANATATVSGAKFFYGTDDTSAIQTLLNTVHTAGGGVVFFPKSIYIISAALQTSVGAYAVNPNSQLWIPYNNSEFTNLRNRPTIELRGEFASVLDQGSALVDRVASNRGSILRSTIQGSGTNPSVIGSQGGAPNDNGNFNRTNLFVKNISIQITCNTSNKATIGGFNCLFASINNFENVTVYPHTLNLIDEVAEPDVIDCTGIIMPKINCEHINSLTRTHCAGFTHGYKLGEHATAFNAVAMCCNNGFTFLETGQSACFQKISAFWCNYDINIPSGTVRAYFKISFLLSEWRQATKWYDSIATINDPDNLGIGELSFDVIEAAVGLNNEKFKRIGALKVVTKPISVPPTNDMQTTTYTLKYTDGYKFIDCWHATSDQTITVPNSSSVTFDKGTSIVINRNGAFNIILVGDTGVTLQYPTGFLAEINQQYDGVELVYRGNNNWALFGALKTA